MASQFCDALQDVPGQSPGVLSSAGSLFWSNVMIGDEVSIYLDSEEKYRPVGGCRESSGAGDVPATAGKRTCPSGRKGCSIGGRRVVRVGICQACGGRVK